VSGTLAGTNETESPVAETGTLAVNDTLPVKPMLSSVTLEVAEPPATKFDGVTGPAEIEKSGSTITLIDAEDERDGLVPVTVIRYDPDGVLLVVVMVIVEVPCPPGDNVRLVGLRIPNGPSDVAGGEDRLTDPEKPRLLTVIVDVADPPATNRVRAFGEAVTVKPEPTVTVIWEVCTSDPTVPVTNTL
jgi:hypothetical protein